MMPIEPDSQQARRVTAWLVWVAVLSVSAGVWALPPQGEQSEQHRDSGNDEAGGDGAACEYHTDCASGLICWAGSCRSSQKIRQMTDAASGGPELTASEMCGADRQCRINYLKRKNRARRHVQQIEQERKAQATIERIKQQQVKQYPRLDRPIGVDWRVSRMGALGVAAGYTFGGHLRGELQLVRNLGSVFQTVQAQEASVDVDGTQSVTFVMPSVYYFFLDGDFSPYLGANFVYGTGELNVRNSSGLEGGGSGDDRALGTEYHALSLEGGLDFQWQGNGFHSRLGVAYRPKVYHQARLSAGNYSELGRKAIGQWYDQTVRIDVVFLVGWNF